MLRGMRSNSDAMRDSLMDLLADDNDGSGAIPRSVFGGGAALASLAHVNGFVLSDIGRNAGFGDGDEAADFCVAMYEGSVEVVRLASAPLEAIGSGP